jgi:DNA-binding MarR family transcriptional regulator
MQRLLKVIRLLKQRRAGEGIAVPTGLLGVLVHIDRQAAGCHARELADSAALDPSTVSRAVTALVAHGLVAREADPHDGRATVLAVTPAGRAALDEALNWYDALIAEALADWSPDEIATFNSSLDRFTGALEDVLTSRAPVQI